MYTNRDVFRFSSFNRGRLFAIKTNGRAEEGSLGFCDFRNEKGRKRKSIMKTAISDGL